MPLTVRAETENACQLAAVANSTIGHEIFLISEFDDMSNKTLSNSIFALKNRRVAGANSAMKLPISALVLSCLLSCGEAVDPAKQLNRGRALLGSGDIATAVIELKNAVQGAPNNSEARLALGKAYLASSNFEAALKEFKRARSFGMASDDLNRNITRALISSGEMGEAATELALNIDESNSDWMTLQGLLDFNVGRYDEAKTGFERALELDPGNVEASRAAIRVASSSVIPRRHGAS